MRLAIMLIVLLAAWVSGCVGAPGQTMTMRDGLGDARDEAEGWGDNLRFAGAAAIEPFRRIQETDDDGTLRGEFVTHLDGNPGDGHAPGWLYTFIADDGRCVGIVLAAGLGVLAEGWEECDQDDAVPLPDAVLDSDDVADLLRDVEGWPRADDSTSMVWLLAAEEDGDAFWEVYASNTTNSATAWVDAVTGNVSLMELDGDGSIANGEGSSSFGSQPLATAATPFTTGLVLEGDGFLSVTADYATSVTSVRLVVSGPEGTLHDVVMQGATMVEFGNLPAGEYTASMIPETAVVQATLMLQGSWAT